MSRSGILDACSGWIIVTVVGLMAGCAAALIGIRFLRCIIGQSKMFSFIFRKLKVQKMRVTFIVTNTFRLHQPQQIFKILQKNRYWKLVKNDSDDI